jgi:hypothetical protein
MTDDINIQLSKEEAIVLFEFLSRLNDNNQDDIFKDQAEQRVLWNIEGTLEKKLVEPFRPDYVDILNRAREKVRDKKEK